MPCRFAVDKEFENTNGKLFRVDVKEIKSSEYSCNQDLQKYYRQ
jgi:hypothetical protein